MHSRPQVPPLPHEANAFRRAMSPNERLYLVGERLAPPFAIQIIVEGSGHIDLPALEAAVSTAALACPGMRVVAKGKSWVDSGRPPPVRRIDNTPFDGQNFASADFLRTRLDIEHGPASEVLLLSGAESTTIVFRAFHGIADGRGVLVWMKDVFRALRGEQLEGADSTETDVGLVKRLGSAFRRPGLKVDCSSPLASVRDVGAVGAVRAVGHVRGVGGATENGAASDGDFIWKRRILRGAHAGLVARLASILASGTAGEPGADVFRFMVPVDLRRHDPTLRSTGNLSLPIFLDAQRGERWEALHGRLLTALSEKRELAADKNDRAMSLLPLFILGGVIRGALRSQRKKGRYPASAILSHLGRIDPLSFSTADFSASTVYSLPVHVPLSPLSLVAVECPSHVELTLACAAGSGMEDRAERLLDRIAETLLRGDVTPWAGNQTRAAYPAEKTVTGLFREQVAATPDAIAALVGDEKITYAELDRRSSVVAAQLYQKGARPGAIIGLLGDRTLPTLSAIWGILKTGAAWLPLSPLYPDDNLAWLLQDARVTLCAAEAKYANRLASFFAGSILALDDVEPTPTAATAQTARLPPSLDEDSDALAYVIYTSGSTGRPKGVQIEHGNLVNYLHWARRAYGVDKSTRFALFTSLSFDLSVTSLFLPLVSGGSVLLVPEEVDHLVLGRVLVGHGVNALKLTPTHLFLINHLHSHLHFAPTGFRVLIVGGEQLKGPVAARAQTLFGKQCRIFNEYGPTEATVGCVYHLFDPARDGSGPAVPIGLPCANTQIHLLDEQRKSVAPGETAEVHITGAGVARGYLDRDHLDREKFVRLWDGTRAYRSGDLARIREDGLLEFRGRTDDQIKIRGYRIEPGEIEAVMLEHPGIEQAVVAGRAPPGKADKVLCAWFVARPLPGTGTGVKEAELRRFLEERLPSHLVPTILFAAPSLPATLNGKVDVRALPDPWPDSTAAFEPDPGGSGSPGSPGNREGPAAARGHIELAVARIWSDLLGIPAESIGPDMDFHLVGGDSLTLIAMLASVASDLVGPEREPAFMQDVAAIIRKPTLANVCRAIELSLRRPPHGSGSA